MDSISREKFAPKSQWLVLVAVILPIIFYLWMRKTTKKSMKEGKQKTLQDIHGPKGYPIIGSVLDIMFRKQDDVEQFIKAFVGDFAKRAKFRVLGSDYLVLYNEEDVEKVLNNKNYLEKGAEYTVLEWIGNGVLTAKGSIWLQTRPIVDQAFHFKAMQKYREVFYSKTMELVETFRKQSEDGGAVDCFRFLLHCGFDIICETMMNTKSNNLSLSEAELEETYSHKLDLAADQMHYRMWRHFSYTNPLGRFLWKISSRGRAQARHFKWLIDFSEKLMRDRREARKTDKSPSISLLDVMLDEQQKSPELFTDTQIRDEINTFLTGGHGATSASTSILLQLLASHPEIQEKVYAELEEVFGEDRERMLTPEEMNKLTYLDCCIKEGLRMYPGVPIFPRKLTRDLELADGTQVPSGTNMLLIPFILHRDPKNFPNPELYIPERFTRENSAKRHPYASIPFSGGARNCIGKNFAMVEIKTFLAHILINFRLEATKEMKDVGLITRIFVKPSKGIYLKFYPR